MQDLEKKLKQLSNHPEWRLRNEVQEKTRQNLLMMEAPVTRTSSRVVDLFARIPRELTDIVARPMAMASLVVVMVLGGWITSVNASLDTVPGDAFYPVKLATERAQLSLAGNSARNRLHAEFASRRLNEVSTLIKLNDGKKDEHVQTALNGFAKQIEAVEGDLRKSTNDQEKVELARIIDDSQGNLEDLLLTPETVADSVSVEAIAVSQKTTDAARAGAFHVLEESYGSAVPTNELSRQFTSDIRGIHAESAVLLQRLGVIESAIDVQERDDIVFDGSILRFKLETIDLGGAENFAASGGYTRAFEITESIRRSIREIELTMARIEIALTRPVVEEVIEDEVIEGVTEEEIVEEIHLEDIEGPTEDADPVEDPAIDVSEEVDLIGDLSDDLSETTDIN
jgi:hypothetical protein